MRMPRTIQALINNSQGKTAPELMAQCAMIKKEDISLNYDGIVTSYSQLPLEKRFYLPRDPLPSCWGDRLQTWEDWFHRERDMRFERIYPLEATWAVHYLMCRAGIEYWLRWLDGFSGDAEIAIFLMYCGNRRREIRDGLEVSCKTKAYPHLRALLFYALVTDMETDDDELAQIVYQYPKELLRPCVTILTDYAFTLKQTKRDAMLEAVEHICSDETTYSLLTAIEESDKGVLAALAGFLCRTSASRQRKERFADEYYRWILRTEDNHPLKDTYELVTVREIQFLNDTAAILSGLDGADIKLLKLWREKTMVYYGWESDTMTIGNGWFQSIGLVLYGIGLRRYQESNDASLLIRVFETTNQFLPAALHDREYDVLLPNLLMNVYEDVPKINELQIKLIQKTINLPLLKDTLEKQKEAVQTDQRVLDAFTARITLLSMLP